MNLNNPDNPVRWDATDYAKNSQGQFGWAMGNVDKLRLQPSDCVLDVGCGDGKITAELAKRVPEGSVTGVDRSDSMIALARQSFQLSNVSFRTLDAQGLDYIEAFDAVFSNSAIHWMPDQHAVVQGIARALKPGGRMFLSMGGRGTAAAPREMLAQLMQESRWTGYLAGASSPHHFRGPEDYGPWLSESGLQADRVELVPKPLRLANLAALEGWLRTTWMTYTERLPESVRAEFIHEWAERVSRRCATTADGALIMPMVNLEVAARKLA
jgi:trans-aconitate methyltransferase